MITKPMVFKGKTNNSVYDDTPVTDKRIRVTRTLVFEGPEQWVRDVMARSWVAPERGVDFGGKTVTELERQEEEL